MRAADMTAGTFAAWQPRYAKYGIATFPVRIVGKDKKPAMSHYDRVGLRGSAQLALKFFEAGSFACMCGRRNRLVIVDMDDTDEKIVDEGERLFGRSPILWRTGGGKFAMPFRHNGEDRRIRPIPGLPIDVLGGGMVVLPPSSGVRRPYELIRGSLADLDHLPIARMPDDIGRKFIERRDPQQRIARGRRRGSSAWRGR
jgi:Bifunctional DNA primase/polymerase, N-terminal